MRTIPLTEMLVRRFLLQMAGDLRMIKMIPEQRKPMMKTMKMRRRCNLSSSSSLGMGLSKRYLHLLTGK